MAEPFVEGTFFGRPFLNQYVEILHEDLNIKIDSLFNTARIKITYYIKADKDGIKIPFLFYASELKDDFEIFIDSQPLKLLDIPYSYINPDSTKFDDFSYFFKDMSFDNKRKWVLIEESPNSGFNITLDDFLYFETDIPKGEHQITASYIANKWIDSWDWVNEYSFRYALSPAKYWKAFGTLDISIDATDYKNELTTNIGEPTEGNLDKIAIWKFDTLPTEILKVIYKPQIDKRAKTLIKIRPDRIAYIVGILLLIMHLILMYQFRRFRLTKRFSWIVIVGSIVFPLLFFLTWTESYTLIDNLIGEHANRQHGYVGLVILLYPIVLPVYWVIMWLIDRWIKSVQSKNALQQKI